jgi:integrase
VKRSKRGRVSSYLVRLEPEQLAQLKLQLEGPPRPPAPTFKQLFDRFMTWSRAQRQKPSTLETKEGLWRVHLEPLLAGMRVDRLQLADVEKVRALELSGKRVNNALCLIRKMLKLAVKWRELAAMPFEIEAVTETPAEFEYYDLVAFPKLVAAARARAMLELLVVLLGGDAGLRMGEQLGLERGDVDLVHAVLRVRRSVWRGQVVAPKGGRGRVVPLTQLLLDTLAAHFCRGKHPRSDSRVLVDELGRPLSIERIRTTLRRAQRAAELEAKGNLHVLRHTFCSHLAMRGASTVSIKELAGHVSISTTEKYMHLADAERARSIRLLDVPRRSDGPRDSLVGPRESLEPTQRSEAIGLSPNPQSNAGAVEHPKSPPGGSAADQVVAALTPTRFELVGESSQVAWLESLIGPADEG